MRWLGLLVLVGMAVRAGAATIEVSAAASLQEALTEIARAYEHDSGDTIRLNFGASGQLLAQITHGAPVDLFISAAQAQMDELKKARLIAGEDHLIARNTLVLIVPASAANPPANFADLTDARFGRIAMGQPKTVPAGEYAMQTIKALKIADAVKPRLVYGLNVRQVLDYVERGEVDAGIVYATDAIAAGEKVKVAAAADEKLHEPIVYSAAVLRDAPQPAAAGAFLAYLSTRPAQAILQKKGFAPPSPTPPAPPTTKSSDE
ncbi:MAG TPA: molybdate ABC transporter substrate-binding protein [Tepidisphaeraceae bacterium]